MAALWARTANVGAVASALVLCVLWGSPAASVVAVDAPVTAALAPGESATPGMVVVLDPQGSPPEVPESLWSGVTAVSAGRCRSLALKAGEVIEWASEWGCPGWEAPPVPEAARSGVTAIAAGGPYLALKDGEVIS